jgi:two-component system, cell cycle sensor histidine kinase and response regulator CckA
MTQPVKILVVEDQLNVRSLIRYMLRKHGFVVLDAATPMRGLTLFRDQHESIALVILDMVMPEMSGLDLAAELDREQPGVKILYISGYAESVVMDSLRQDAPDKVLLKPFTEESLIERVTHLLAS